MDPKTGDVVAARFRLGALLGKGGMGSVFAATDDHERGAPVAVKLLHGALLNDDDAVVRFRREADLCARARSPYLVAVRAHGGPGPWFVAMELLPGETLRALLTRRRSLPAAEACRVVAAVARGLAAAHAHGVVHRDVKPQNIMVLDDSAALARGAKAVLLDFGIARPVERGATMTTTGMFVGTPGYIAPEVALQGSPPGPRADLYSLGCVLYECLTGAAVFQAPTPMALLMRHASEAPTPPRERVPWLSPALEALVLELLDKAPGNRPADAQTVAERLEACARSEAQRSAAPARSVGPLEVSAEAPTETATAATTRRRPVVDAPTTVGTPPAPTSPPVSPPLGVRFANTGHVVAENAYARITLDDDVGIRRVTRTTLPIAKLAEPLGPFVSVMATFPPERRKLLRLLVDVRNAPPSADGRFEEDMKRNRAEIFGGWHKAAVLVRTFTGVLQSERMERHSAMGVRVFKDEGEAVSWLLS
jgi:serine/threonine protein kinase